MHNETKGRGMSMRFQRFALVACLAAALSVAVTACGSSNDKSSSSSDSGGSVAKGKTGGSVTALAAADVDYMDPGQVYYTFGYQIAYSVNRALYYYNPATGQKQIPDLAESDPEVSSDRKTITIKLRKGVKFAPPVNREVTSADVKYAMERVFSANVPNSYALAT